MKKIVNFIKLWPEVYAFPLAIALWYFHGKVLLLLDPTSIPLDSGVISKLILAVCYVLTASGLAFLGMRLNWPAPFNYYSKELKNDFNNLTSWQKIKVALVVFFGLLFAFVFAVHTI